MPWPSGRKSDKHQCLSGAGALYAMSEAMEHIAVGYGSSSAPGALLNFQSSPKRMTRAIRLVEDQETHLDDQAILQAVGLFRRDPSLATAYLAFGRQGLRSKWLEQELAVDSAAAASQLHFPMYPLE